MTADTIFALSSGQVPAALGVVRISGPDAARAAGALAGSLPPPRRAGLRVLRDPADGGILDTALVLWFPAPASATGEDCAELHCHGGRAVIAAVSRALAAQGLRAAEPGEFTRRAFANGRLDLAEVEGLGDLLAAETELQRLSAQAMAGGALSREAERWRDDVLMLSAAVEAMLDFSDEDDVGAGDQGVPPGLIERAGVLATAIGEWLDRPRAEPLREGFRVVLAGPPNAGKSTLFNALIESEGAIVSPEPGTTRDVLVAAVAIEGVPFSFVDTAGLREAGAGAIEAIGIARARDEAGRADLVLWLGAEGEGPTDRPVIELLAQCDRVQRATSALRVSAVTGEGMAVLRRRLLDHARSALPQPGMAALNRRQAECLSRVRDSLLALGGERDGLIAAEHLRVARRAIDALVGRADVEAMLDSLFGRFCIGK